MNYMKFKLNDPLHAFHDANVRCRFVRRTTSYVTYDIVGGKNPDVIFGSFKRTICLEIRGF